MENETVMVIEIGGSHDECLLTQFHALKLDNKRIVFVSTEEVMQRNPVFYEYIDQFFLFDKSSLKKSFKMARRIKKLVKMVKAKTVIMNTAHGNTMRNLSIISLFSKVQFLGILHTIIKLEGSFTQRVISLKVKKYYLLSEFLYRKAKIISKLDFTWFYPLRFDFQLESPAIKEKKLKIVIIGGVESRRKDLLGFVDMIDNLTEDVQFVFLGKSDPNNDEVCRFKQRLNEKKCSEKVTLFDSFVENETFAQIVQSCDAILPLVHPVTPSAKEYFNRQISGAMTVAFGYKKPLLIHEGYKHIEELAQACVYYNQENFKEIIKERETLIELEDKMKTMLFLKEETQEKRYLDFLHS